MKNGAKRIVKTANLLRNFLVSVSLAPEQQKKHINICVFALIIRRANRTRLETLCFNRQLFLWTPWLYRIPCDYLKKDMAFEKKYPKCVPGYLVQHI
jgi:hypothetical protein